MIINKESKISWNWVTKKFFVDSRRLTVNSLSFYKGMKTCLYSVSVKDSERIIAACQDRTPPPGRHNNSFPHKQPLDGCTVFVSGTKPGQYLPQLTVRSQEAASWICFIIFHLTAAKQLMWRPRIETSQLSRVLYEFSTYSQKWRLSKVTPRYHVAISATY